MPDWADTLRIVDRQTPAVRRAFLDAVRAAQGAPTATALRRALQRRDYTSVVSMLDTAWGGQSERWQTILTGQIHATIGEVGALESARIGGVFNLVNPAAVAAARTASLSLVTRVGREQREAIRGFLTETLQTGAPVSSLARRIRGVVGLDRRRTRALANYTRDVTARLPGVFIRQDQLVEKYAAKLLRQRASTIAATEMARAATTGQMEAWRQSVAAGLIPADRGKQWVATPDDVWCQYCQGLHRQVVPLNALFVSAIASVEAPPLHPNCRCAVRLAKRPATARRRAAGRRSGPSAGVTPARRAVAPRARPTPPVPAAPVSVQGAVLTEAEQAAVRGLARRDASVNAVLDRLGMGEVTPAVRREGRYAREAREAREAAERATQVHKKKYVAAEPKTVELSEVFGHSIDPEDAYEVARAVRTWKYQWYGAKKARSIPDPDLFAREMLTDLDDVEWTFSMSGGGMWGGDEVIGTMEAVARHADWPVPMRIERTFTRLPDGRLLVSHDLFRVPEVIQDSGIGRAVLGRQFAFYDKIGVARVEVHANIDIGGYTWARMGFLPDDATLRRLADQVGHRWNQLTKACFDDAIEMDLGPELADAVERTIKELRDGDPTALWRLSDMTESVAWKGPVDAEGAAEHAVHKKVAGLVFNDPKHQTLKLGQALLKQADWYGHANWDDAAQMQRLRSYFSGKR